MSGSVSIPASYQSAIASASQQYGVPVGLINALGSVESGWSTNPSLTSSAGAVGPLQVKPTTAAGLGFDAYDPLQNIQAGVAYLAQQYKTFGNWTQALEAYNAGPSGNLAGSADYAQSVLSAAGGVPDSSVAPAGANQVPTTTGTSAATATAPTGMGFYLVAIVLIVLLVAFGLWGVIKSA